MILWILYILCSATHLASIEMEATTIGFISKILLMPLLGLIVYTAKPHKMKKWLLLALLFSWMGDALLTKPDFLFFLLGLGSFLISHLFYILLFSKESKHSGELTKVEGSPSLLIPFVLFGLGVLFFIVPKIDDTIIKIAISCYTLVILTMAVQALNRSSSVSKKSFLLVFLGALFFIISDSMIAINRFVQPFEMQRIAIMSTYVLAQGLIVFGVLLNFKEQK